MPEQLGDPREVLLQHGLHRRRVERGGGMEERVERDLVAAENDLLGDAVHARDPGRLAREQLRREVAERRDELGPDQLDLAEQVRLAGLDLLRMWIAIPRRSALEDVDHEDVRARRARFRRATCRGACRPGRRTESRSDPRGSPVPRRRTSGRRAGRRSRRRPAFAWPRADSACSPGSRRGSQRGGRSRRVSLRCGPDAARRRARRL